MRGTIIMLSFTLFVLLAGGLYLFGSTERPEVIPKFKCEVSRLRYSAAWEPSDGGLAGSLTVENDSVKPCRLEGFPEVSLRTETLEMTTAPFWFERKMEPHTLNRGMRAEAGFVWTNWCGDDIDSPMFVVFKLPNYAATFTVPILDEDNTPSTRTPECDSADKASELSVGPFVQEGESLFSDE